MNPQDPLTQLQPLREPDLVSWWPLAPGWWILCGLLLLLLLSLAWWLLHRYRANAYRRQALRQLDQLQEAFRHDGDSKDTAAAINALLKAVALRAYPRRDIAASSGGDWQAFLDSTGGDGFPAGFASAAYHRECPELDMEKVLACARLWIRRHEVAR